MVAVDDVSHLEIWSAVRRVNWRQIVILVIDNLDSFTYNLVQFLGEMGADLQVIRNDKTTLDEIRAMQPTHIVISPGPGTPMMAASRSMC